MSEDAISSSGHLLSSLARFTERAFRRLYHDAEAAPRPAHADANAIRANLILYNLSEGVVVQGLDGRVVMMNAAAKALLGGQKAFWNSELGRLFEAYRELAHLDSEMQQLGGPRRVQINDRILGVTAAAVATKSGERIGTVIVLRDVTREAITERLKDEFVSQISHELRTPLTVIKGFSDVLLHTPEDIPPKRQFLESISRNAAVLDRMIIELLDLSEMGAGTFAVRKDPLSLSDLVWDVLRGVEGRIRRAGLELHVFVMQPDLEVWGDEARLKWAVGHLLDNAIKYTPAGGEIVVRCGSKRGDHAILEVTDTGVGIHEKDQPHIFERFYRGEARTADGKLLDPRGLGQGLYVVQSVVEAHNGYVTAASRQGEGSTFTVALPAIEPLTEDTLPLSAMVEPPVDPEATTVPHVPLPYELIDDSAPPAFPGVS